MRYHFFLLNSHHEIQFHAKQRHLSWVVFRYCVVKGTVSLFNASCTPLFPALKQLLVKDGFAAVDGIYIGFWDLDWLSWFIFCRIIQSISICVIGFTWFYELFYLRVDYHIYIFLRSYNCRLLDPNFSAYMVILLCWLNSDCNFRKTLAVL